MIALVAMMLAAALPMDPASSAYADEKGNPLKAPEAVACSDSGAVVAGDTGNARLVLFTFKDGAFKGGTEVKADELGRPLRVQIDSKGNVLSLDAKTRRIARFGAGGAFSGFLPMKGVPPARGFFPASFKLDAQDNAWILDASSQRIVIVDAAGTYVREIALPQGASITDIAVDGRKVWAADARRAALWVAEKDVFVPLVKSMREYLNYPAYVTAAPQGALVIVDQHGNGVVLLGRDGNYLGRRLSIGSGEGFVYYPSQVCVDGKGNTFVADRGNNRIQAFTAGK